ncbi:PP2C family serine/threonine-protein phosphatase [Dyadobacter sp. CY343]|uniref:PP2C family protein-serine/threonine phosphatase n=1 Tax=Dyadobacter sp. CY343 TaxID=2907299 RepID=UPI001F4060B2|nr:protein phosphatase 2C domain-containing protein [Dyadobacter sp. CY343]MCE7059230.1 protein phosphatase 2C domain-containing protein [Dyadobacter sp. CY343]
MKVDIYQPVGFTEVGQRANNEDHIYPPLNGVSNNTLLFLVCDGVGGQHKGEVASALACASISSYFEQNRAEVADDAYINKALRFTVDNFTRKESEDKETSGMATTLTLLHFNEAGATIAHLGDSRIYQIRNSQVIRVSEDHKLVNDLVREGHITATEAETHSQRNVITKVISADRMDTPDVKIINDVAPGDYFFLCTDGVLEHIHDELLAYHLRDGDDNQISDAEKLENIRLECVGRTRDNFSAYLVRVNAVTGTVPPAYVVDLPPVAAAPALPVAQPVRSVNPQGSYELDAPTEFSRPQVPSLRSAPDPPPLFRHPAAPKPPRKKFKPLPYVIGVFIGIIATAAGMLYQRNNVPQPASQIRPEAKIPEVAATPKIESATEEKKTETQIEQLPKKPAEPAANDPGIVYDKLLAKSESHKFILLIDKGIYYAWEPEKKKKTKIDYNQLLSVPNVLHYYNFPGNKKGYLFLSNPDIRIDNVDSVDIGTSETIYYKDGQKNKIENATGRKVNLSVKDMKEKLTDQVSSEVIPN